MLSERDLEESGKMGTFATIIGVIVFLAFVLMTVGVVATAYIKA